MLLRRSISGSESGAVLVESSMCLGAFLLTLFCASDLLRVSYVYLATQHAVQMTTSWATLGEVDTGKTRVRTIEDAMIRKAGEFGVTLERNNIYVCPAGGSRYCETEDAGEPRTDFQISVVYPTFVSTLHRNIRLEFDAQGRNERPS